MTGLVPLNCESLQTPSLRLIYDLFSFPRREDVERANNTRMARLSGEEKKYQSTDGGTCQGEQRERLLNNFMAPNLLCLRKDAQVMCIKNLDETLVNGSMGRVLRFVDPAIYNTELDEESDLGRLEKAAGSKDEKPSVPDKVSYLPRFPPLLNISATLEESRSWQGSAIPRRAVYTPKRRET